VKKKQTSSRPALSGNEHYSGDRTALKSWIRLLSKGELPKIIVRAGKTPGTCHILARNRKFSETFRDASGGHPGRIQTLADLPFLLHRNEDKENWEEFTSKLYQRVEVTKTFEIADPPNPEVPAAHLQHVRHFEVTFECIPGEARYCTVKFLDQTFREERAVRHHKFPKVYAEKRGKELIQSYLDLSHPVAVGFIDLDHFGELNKEKGHDVGDLILNGVIDFFNTELREADIFYNKGGDEFIVALSLRSIPQGHDAEKHITSALRNLVERFFNQGIDTGAEVVRVGMSFGVAVVTDFTTPHSVEDLIKEADRRMRKNKKMKHFVVDAKEDALRRFRDEANHGIPRDERTDFHEAAQARLFGRSHK
jgi:diguanylate cyclase (GGDEF)-like protein